MRYDLDQMIADIDLPAVIEKANCLDVVPRDYQALVYKITGDEIRKYAGPIVVTASVGAGKTYMMGMLAKRFQDIDFPGLLLARTAELVEQNASALWECGAKNSIYSDGAGKKSRAYNIAVASEKSFFNAMNTVFSDFTPRWLLIDECHMLNWEDLKSGNPTSQYAKIVIEMQMRCRAKHGSELRIIGYTGSPFRHTTPIIGPFWTKQICDISTDYLVERGFLVPTVYADIDDDDMYDLSMFKSRGEYGAAEYTDEELAAMQKEIMAQGTKTHQIMLDVVRRTADRNGVLITCSGVKHCEEAAKYLQEGSYAIITDRTSAKARKAALASAKNGDIKYILQIGCLTTGVDVSYWDTSVILRKIGSLTLLIQLLGRGMRLLKEHLSKKGIKKSDHLVLDYTDTMAELGELYSNPILEAAQLAKARQNKNIKPCPKCGTENAGTARRCIGEDDLSYDGRCEYFFQSKECGDRFISGVGNIKGCHAKNDPCARQCRKCGQQIYDPNENLSHRPYTEDDYVDVHSFNVRLTKDSQGVLYEYGIRIDGKPYTAREVFWPNANNPGKKNAWKAKGIFPHVKYQAAISKLLRCRNAASVMALTQFINAPKRITHRLNDKNRDIINRKKFDG
jgi:DNA repair protein RadD